MSAMSQSDNQATRRVIEARSRLDARERRAVWALELAGTPEARALLVEWSEAKVGNRLCVEAAAALKRLQRNK